MKIVFMGTPDFAVLSLRTLLEQGYDVAAVFTQPDRPKGRKKILTPPPVKVEAEKHGIRVFQPVKLRDPTAVAQLKEIAPDLIVTAAYGQILPKSVLSLPRFGCINVHASLLPKYRGGAPIHHAIMNGEPRTGVTVMYMAEGLDTGDMISKVEVPIEDSDTTGSMFEKLSLAGAKLLRDTLPDLLAGNVTAVAQNHEDATYAPNLTREDEKIDWNRTSLQIFNQVRGQNPWPGTFTTFNGEVLKIWACFHPVNDNPEQTANSRHVPGTIVQVSARGVEVKTGDGSIWLRQVQPAGKKSMDIEQFIRGGKIAEGAVLS
jgi:methionyl-tRNA formyltransferase